MATLQRTGRSSDVGALTSVCPLSPCALLQQTHNIGLTRQNRDYVLKVGRGPRDAGVLTLTADRRPPTANRHAWRSS